MKEFRWDEQKNKKLKEARGVSFEEILDARFISAERHPSRDNQMIMLFEYKKYIWIVPCVIEKDYVFLKTLFPSRKYTREVIRNEKD